MKNHTIAILGCVCLILSAFLSGLYIGRNIGSSTVHTSVLKPVETVPKASVPPLPSAPEAAESVPPARPSRVNINTATAEQLAALPGVGPVLAESIINYRQHHGRFQTIRDLMKVSGIGEKRFESIEDYITTGR